MYVGVLMLAIYNTTIDILEVLHISGIAYVSDWGKHGTQ